MNNKRMTRDETLLICIGLLMVTLPTLINDWINIPDFVRGAFMGVGLVLEIIGLMRLVKRKKNQGV